MKKIKLLFQGDSITDWYRNHEDYHDLGKGYANFAAELIKEKYPDTEFEFINLGISGNQTKDLVDRLQSDFIDINPDVVSILIGINDVWSHATEKDWIENNVFEERYRTVLAAVKENTDAKIMMIEPFLIPVQDRLFFREDLNPKIDIIRKLAREYADIYLPTDGLLASAYIGNNPSAFAEDGVHPSDMGAKFIAKLYTEYISTILDKLID